MSGTRGSGRRKPVALKIYEGEKRTSPADLDAEPRFRPGIEDCPAWLPLLAQEYWRHILPELIYVPGLLQRVDRASLEQVCLAYHRWRTLEQFCLENGEVVPHEQHYIDENGTPAMKAYPKARPEAKLRKEASAELARLRGELGLSPVARTRIHNPQVRPTARGLLDSDAI